MGVSAPSITAAPVAFMSSAIAGRVPGATRKAAPAATTSAAWPTRVSVPAPSRTSEPYRCDSSRITAAGSGVL